MRKAQAKKLPLSPDPRYNDKLVTRFVNNIMWQGKKSGAYNIFYDAVEKVSKQTNEDGYEVFKIGCNGFHLAFATGFYNRIFVKACDQKRIQANII